MTTNGRYDVIIIGTGAGGGTLARRLAPSGKRILLLERGGWVRREKENWESRAVLTESRYKAHETGKFSNVPGWGGVSEALSYVATTHAFFTTCRGHAEYSCTLATTPSTR